MRKARKKSYTFMVGTSPGNQPPGRGKRLEGNITMHLRKTGCVWGSE
jgi:hypothetical protein